MLAWSHEDRVIIIILNNSQEGACILAFVHRVVERGLMVLERIVPSVKLL